ncbi:uncharacterized protein HMPREF1541_07173 [Cyphellophora europaea CBS 101466]|uniref:Oxysterol-binding protein n=1 Tax=Cyphellophora europaea (strain CBS 101466) TaxID=1220924 RepID=W2RM14_CYPE1|nr:uncharacterized protein HMPREF1541_07173 [Cyphellophora europaea CBS 101466]ETN37551.1 hypothetical protein HMPREF1541_07173 [Cyphellophora europaea CBS 101466]
MRHHLGSALRPRSESLKSNRSSTEETRDADQEETVVEPEQNNVLSHIIAQLRPGADLSRITLPTFILEERSMLERITNFMAHPETLLPMPEIDDPVQRFVSVIKFYLSGWHIKPPGVKKPLNPILGETFTCWWEYKDGTKGYYISEQTSHHPPKSSYFFMAPEHHIRVDGTLRPRSKFLGNSAASLMEGISYLTFLNRQNERYIITQPNMYARGILFGKMKYELGDHSYVRCPATGLSADLEFKTKGWVAGTYNAIGGIIKNEQTGEQLYELSGLWTGEMFIKDLTTGQKKPLFDATHAKHTPPLTRPIEEQSERESQRLWLPTVKAVHVKDHVKATDEKAKIEDRQREEARQREEKGEQWAPKLFRPVRPGSGESEGGSEDLEWIINAEFDTSDPKKCTEQILAIAPILPGSGAGQGSVKAPNETTSGKESTTSTGTSAAHQATSNLIDFDSRPASTAPPEPKVDAQSHNKGATEQHNLLHPTSDPQQTQPVHQSTVTQAPTGNAKAAAGGNLLDFDDEVHDTTNKVSSLNMSNPAMQPRSPLQRTDTGTSEVDVFVDAEEK